MVRLFVIFYFSEMFHSRKEKFPLTSNSDVMFRGGWPWLDGWGWEEAMTAAAIANPCCLC